MQTDEAAKDPMQGGETLAAVDLGSNAFKMVIARVTDGEFHVVNRMRESVRLAAGVDAAGKLSPEAKALGLECLSRFGEVLRDVEPERVRAVGTNTLRRLSRKGGDFLETASTSLGHPIEIISGLEEARLIYLGVTRTIAEQGHRRLVVDIGGGSTECIIGERAEPQQADSLYMGCVTFSQRFFGDGGLSNKRMRKAEIAALQELEPIRRNYRSMGWDKALGASGTIQAVHSMLKAAGWGDAGITADGLRWLREALLEAKNLADIELPGLKPDRAPVIAGGLAILTSVFEALQVESMQVSEGALREGLLLDLVGREHDEDRRDATIRRMAARYKVDTEQAARVEATALSMLHQSQGFVDDVPGARRVLAWAAELHEIGLAVAFSGYHKHGAYLVAESDMPGFSRTEQELLAALVLQHRRKLTHASFHTLGPAREERALRLCVLLRLAVRLHRSRSSRPLPPLSFKAGPTGVGIDFPTGWLDTHPLTRADLETEAQNLEKAGLTLRFS